MLQGRYSSGSPESVRVYISFLSSAANSISDLPHQQYCLKWTSHSRKKVKSIQNETIHTQRSVDCVSRFQWESCNRLYRVRESLPSEHWRTCSHAAQVDDRDDQRAKMCTTNSVTQDMSVCQYINSRADCCQVPRVSRGSSVWRGTRPMRICSFLL